MIFALIAMAQDPVTLEHKGKRGQSADYRQTLQFGIELKGRQEVVDQFKGLSPLFAIQKIALDGHAVHEVVKTPNTWKYTWQKAKVSGRYDGEEFEYAFTRDKAVDPGDDKLKQIAYGLFAGGRSHKLSPRGQMEDSDPNKDAVGEALDLILFPMPHFKSDPVKAGDTWTEEWLSRTADKEGKFKLRLKHVVTLQKVEGPRATLKVALSGAMEPLEGKDLGWNKSVTPRGEAAVEFDVERGSVIGYESSGSVDLHLQGSDPNTNTEVTLDIVLAAEGKLLTR